MWRTRKDEWRRDEKEEDPMNVLKNKHGQGGMNDNSRSHDEIGYEPSIGVLVHLLGLGIVFVVWTDSLGQQPLQVLFKLLLSFQIGSPV